MLILDKPASGSSHDLVGRMRRQLGTKRIGHAGTLDPMASGVLVILVGEATKLGPYLTAHTKRYTARVAFGLATETLDREGAPTASAEVPGWLLEEIAARGGPRIEAALAAERARTAQIPPAYSAIKVDGKRSYARARSGEAFDLPERPVEVVAMEIVGGEGAMIDLDLTVTKGYYVRSLARDLGTSLGVPAHLAALRRTASGPFTLEDAVAPDAEDLRVIPQSDAVRRSLAWTRLTPSGVRRARFGQPLEASDFADLPPLDVPSAWLDDADRLVAIGSRQGENFVLYRGFMSEDTPTG